MYNDDYKGFSRLRPKPKARFNYYYYGKIAFLIFLEALDTFHGDQNIWINVDGEGDEMVPGRMVINDLNQVVFPLAIAAWLTIDEWKLNTHFDNEDIPTDLSYGLVLEYPIPTIRMALQFIEPFSSLSMEITKENHESAKEKAIEEVQRSFNYTREQCEKLVPKRVELEL